MKKLIKFYTKINEKYQLNVNTTSIAFYTILSVSSFFVLFVTILFNTSEVFKLFMINKIMEIIGETFSELLNETINRISISHYGILLLFSAIFSSSSIINRLTIYTDKLYEESDRSYIRTRIGAVLSLAMLIIIVLLELGIVIYSDYLLTEVLLIKSDIVHKILIHLFEILIIYFIISYLYIYLPPYKVLFRDIKKTSFIITLIIYLCFAIFIIIFQYISRISIIGAISYLISLIGTLLHIIIAIFLLGLINNYQNRKHIKWIE